MKVILSRDIKKLGKVCDVCDVKDGYGRNFLLPNGYAVVANEENMKKLNKTMENLHKKNAELTEKAKKVAEILDKKVFNVVRQAADDGTIYGSIKARDVYQFVLGVIADNKIDFVLNNSSIELPYKIKMLGQYVIPIGVFGDITANVRLNVCRTTADYEEDSASFDKKRECSLNNEKENKTKFSVDEMVAKVSKGVKRKRGGRGNKLNNNSDNDKCNDNESTEKKEENDNTVDA